MEFVLRFHKMTNSSGKDYRDQLIKELLNIQFVYTPQLNWTFPFNE